MRTELKYQPLPKDLLSTFFKTEKIRFFPSSAGELVSRYVLKDVCEVLGIPSVSQAARLTDEPFTEMLIPTSKGPRRVKTLTLEAVMDIATSTRSEQAKAFQKFVNKELLPAIIRRGYWGNSVEVLLNSRQKHLEALATISNKLEEGEITRPEATTEQKTLREEAEKLFESDAYCVVPLDPVDYALEESTKI